MNLSVIITLSDILKQDCPVPAQYFILVTFIHQKWLHFGKQFMCFFFSLSIHQTLCPSSSGLTAKGAAADK